MIPYRSSRDASVLVLGFPRKGANVRCFPLPSDPNSAAAASRVPAGDHVLPSERIELGRSGATVEYHRGCLVPIGAVAMDVVVAAREKPLDAAEIATLDAGLAGDTKAAVLDRLRSNGFAVRELRVLEPKD